MRTSSSRRTFLSHLGGALALGALGGPALATAPATGLRLRTRGERLAFGRLDTLATLLQETPPDRLQGILIEKLRSGTSLEDVVAAGALANARAFGGEDYTGYHCLMAMMPAYEMSGELRGEARWLPVLKVMYRNAARVQELGSGPDTLQVVDVPESMDPAAARRAVQAGFLARDVEASEAAFFAGRHGAPREALDDVQEMLRENLDVHRVVLVWRSWDVLQLTGEAHADTLLRQTIRFCVAAEERRIDRGHPTPKLRTLMPALLDEYGLTQTGGKRRDAADAEVEELARLVFAASPEDAADATAGALASGMTHEDVGEALSIAANTLLLNDPGRRYGEEGKPKGSVHGASVGVHASDAARAWRNLASVSDDRNAAANLIAGAYHTAGQSQRVGEDAFPYAQHRERFEECDGEQLLAGLERYVSTGNQEKAAACAALYGERGLDPAPLFALLLENAIEADGALHAEKYYRTVREDFASARPAHRWPHVVALARVSASQNGFEAPGLAEARERLQG